MQPCRCAQDQAHERAGTKRGLGLAEGGVAPGGVDVDVSRLGPEFRAVGSAYRGDVPVLGTA